jgi:hypothetical protein
MNPIGSLADILTFYSQRGSLGADPRLLMEAERNMLARDPSQADKLRPVAEARAQQLSQQGGDLPGGLLSRMFLGDPIGQVREDLSRGEQAAKLRESAVDAVAPDAVRDPRAELLRALGGAR